MTVDSSGRFRAVPVTGSTDWWIRRISGRHSRSNFAPRFSFAYDLFGKQRTSVRGGYGMFYSREILGAFILMSGNPPFSELLTVDNTILSNPGGGTARNYDLPITLGSIDTNQLTPYTQQWNFNIQHSSHGTTVLEVGYSGSRALHMMRTQDINQPLPRTPLFPREPRTQTSCGRIKVGASSIIANRATLSNYHGLQVGLNRSFSKGLMGQIAYTWSKAIDNADFTAGIYGFVPNTQDSSGERGRANFDATHNFVASYVWDIPFLKDRRDVFGKVLGGWQYSGVVNMRTGLPINPLLGRDIAGVGSSDRQRPQAIRSPVLSVATSRMDPLVRCRRPTCSPLSELLVNGTEHPLRTGLATVRHVFHKIVRFGEGRQFELRADGFNIFNHTQFDGIGTTFFTPATFGKVTSTRNERNFMVGARIQF